MNKKINGKQWHTFQIGQYVTASLNCRSRTPFNWGRIIGYNRSQGSYVIECELGIERRIAKELIPAQVIDAMAEIDGRPCIAQIIVPLEQLS